VINGVPRAYITDFSVSVQENVRQVITFGSPAARSIEPLSTSCSVRIGRVIPLNNADGTPVNAGVHQEGLVPTIQDMITAEDMTIEMIDKVTGAVLASVRNCRPTGHTLSMAGAAIGTQNLTFVGIYDSAGDNSPDKLGF